MELKLYTVEWGRYSENKLAAIQTGDIELMARSEEDAINRAKVPPCDWCHAYIGPSKWG